MDTSVPFQSAPTSQGRAVRAQDVPEGKKKTISAHIHSGSFPGSSFQTWPDTFGTAHGWEAGEGLGPSILWITFVLDDSTPRKNLYSDATNMQEAAWPLRNAAVNDGMEIRVNGFKSENIWLTCHIRVCLLILVRRAGRVGVTNTYRQVGVLWDKVSPNPSHTLTDLSITSSTLLPWTQRAFKV